MPTSELSLKNEQAVGGMAAKPQTGFEMRN
jgi:hypothetical protein